MRVIPPQAQYLNIYQLLQSPCERGDVHFRKKSLEYRMLAKKVYLKYKASPRDHALQT